MRQANCAMPMLKEERRDEVSGKEGHKVNLRLIESTAKQGPFPPTLFGRDPAFIKRVFPALAAMADSYYRAEVEGIENLSDKACLIVSTHNGGLATPDAYCLVVAFWRRFGLEAQGYGLMHRASFYIPMLGGFLNKLGAIPASTENGQRVLHANHPLFVCPGGDIDALKPFTQRHKIFFGKRRGFIRLALREQVPIIPVVSVGAHETLLVLNDGRWLADLIGLSRRYRIKTVPVTFSFPLGFTLGSLFSIPLPSKIRIRILPPITLSEPPTAADDKQAVERCFAHVRERMQSALDELASRRKRFFLG